eukprot:scaffold7.g3671.t1
MATADLHTIVEALRASRDVATCLHGLNQFRRALRAGGGDGGGRAGAMRFLLAYLRHSPAWEELHGIWDAQLTLQHYQITITLLLALADCLELAGEAAALAAAGGEGAAPGEADGEGERLPSAEAAQLAAAGGTLAASILHRRLKAIYFLLSSEARGKATAAQLLLAALAGAPAATGGASGSGAGDARGAPAAAAGGASACAELVRTFDWGLSALPALAKLPRPQKGETAAVAQARAWAAWRSADALKRPTRAAFVRLALALLRAAAREPLVLAQLLGVRPLLGGLLHHLAADPPENQLEVLEVLSKRVFGRRAGVAPALQADLLTDAALGQLVAVSASATDEAEGKAREEAGDEQGHARAAAAAAAHRLVLAAATDPSHGLCSGGAAAPATLLAAAAAALAPTPAARRLLRLLARLRPADSASHLDVVTAAATGRPSLAAGLLLGLPYSLEPCATGRWFAHAAVVGRLQHALFGSAGSDGCLPPGLLQLAHRGLPPPALGSPPIQALLRCCLPAALPKAALSRGLQHSPAVRHAMLSLLCHCLGALHILIADLAAAAAAARTGPGPAEHHAQRGRQWEALGRGLAQAARALLPDPQPLLAILAGLEKEEGGLVAGSNGLLLAAVLRALLLWQRCLPGALAESHIDAERLVPQQPQLLAPHLQLQYLQLMMAAAGSTGGSAGGSARGSATSCATLPSQLLLPVLRMLTGPMPEVSAAATAWLRLRLAGTGAFVGNVQELELWLGLLPRDGEATASFLADAVAQLQRRPHEVWQASQEHVATLLPGAAEQPEVPPPQWQFSLLAPCALRQALRVLPSPKAAPAAKRQVSAYVASVLRQLVQQQLAGDSADPPAAVVGPLAAALLGVARQEATRHRQQRQEQQQQQHGEQGAQGRKQEGKKRVRDAGGEEGPGDGPAVLELPPEGAPLLRLLAVLEEHMQQLQLRQGGDGERAMPEQAAKRRKKGKGSEAAAAPAPEGVAARPRSIVEVVLAEAPTGMAEANGAVLAAGAHDGEVGGADGGDRSGPPCCWLINMLGEQGAAPPGEGGTSAGELVAAIQQRLAAGAWGAAAAARQALHWLEQLRWQQPPGVAAAAAALVSVLHAAVAAAATAAAASGADARGAEPEQLEQCADLLNDSALVAASLQESCGQQEVLAAVGIGVVQVLHELLSSDQQRMRGVGSSSAQLATRLCAPLLERVVSAFTRALAANTSGSGGSGAMPPQAYHLLLLLPHVPAAQLAGLASPLLDRAAAAAAEGRMSSRRSGWVVEAAAVTVSRLAAAACAGERAVPGPLLRQASSTLVQLAGSCHEPAVASWAVAVDTCLLQLLSPAGLRAQVLAALGSDGQQRLLHACLERTTPFRSRLAAALLSSGANGGAVNAAFLALCGRLLPAAMAASKADGAASATGSAASDRRLRLALLLPAATTVLQAATTAGEVEAAADAVAAALRQQLFAFLRAKQPADAADAETVAAAGLLPSTGEKAAAAALVVLGPATAAAGAAVPGAEAAAAGWEGREARAADLLPLVQACVSTLAALFKLYSPTPAQCALEHQLLGLLDGPVGDALAALPDVDRTSPTFADLAAAVCGTFGTAVLRHRLRVPTAAAEAETAAAAADTEGLGTAGTSYAGPAAVMRVLRRFAAALLPEGSSSDAAQADEMEAEAGPDASESRAPAASESPAESSSESESEDADSSSSSSSDEEGGSGHGRRPARMQQDERQAQAEQEQVSNPRVAEAAVELLRRLMTHSRFLPIMRAAAASPPPLPAGADALPRPLPSLLAAVELPCVEGPPAAPAAAAAADAEAVQLKRELCELAETLLDLQQQYDAPPPAPAAAPAPHAATAAAAAGALLPLLMAGYGASMSETDRAVWSLAVAANRRLWEAGQAPAGLGGGGDGAGTREDAEALEALLEGPLSRTWFAWGPAAAAVQQIQAQSQAGTGAAPAPSSDPQQQQQARAALLARLPLDPARSALVVAHFPEWRSLLGNDGSSTSAAGGTGAGGPPPLPHSAAGYDPAFLLPFCLSVLRGGLLGPRAFAAAGLLSVCLRALAAEDAALRGVAYEAVALASQQMEGGDFREKAQLSVLLSVLRASLPSPLLRLPAPLAALLAEAAAVALAPGAPMFAPLGKFLLRRATLGLQGGGPGHSAQRRWALQLLLAGLRDGGAARLCRRTHLLELCMSLHGACVAEPEAAALALAVVCRAAAVHRAARELAQQSGLVGWLACAAARGAVQHLRAARAGGGPAGEAALPAEAALPLAALRGLLGLRAVMRGAGASSVLADLVAACRQLAAALCASDAPGAAGGPSLPLWAEVLPLVAAVQAACAAAAARSRGGGSRGWLGAQGLGAHEVASIARAAEAAAAAAEAGGEGGPAAHRVRMLAVEIGAGP